MNRIQTNSGNLFHALLMRCLADQHQPTDEEIDLVAGKIWHESRGSATGQPWLDVARGSDAHRQMVDAAMMALTPCAREPVPLR